MTYGVESAPGGWGTNSARRSSLVVAPVAVAVAGDNSQFWILVGVRVCD
jgi:hypothetical protein